MIFVLKYWRVLALGAGLLLVGWYIKHVEAVSYRQGASEKEESMLKDEAARIEASTAEQQKALDDKAATLDAQSAAIQSERSALSTQRKAVTDALTTGLSNISARDMEIRNATAATPDADIVPDIRRALDAIRAAESARAAVGH